MGSRDVECVPPSTMPVGYLIVPRLTAQTAAPCPPAPLLADSSLGALTLADAALSTLYAQCQARHGAAVEAYQAVFEAAEQARQAVR